MTIGETIAANSSEIKTAATALSDKIVEAQFFFARIPGRVETTFAAPEITLVLHRDGTEWMISVALGDGGRKHLSECSVKLKMMAVARFRDLYQSIGKAQAEYLTDLRKACNAVDEFLQTK